MTMRYNQKKYEVCKPYPQDRSTHKIWQHKNKALLAKHSHSKPIILTLRVNHKEPKYITYVYDIFQTTKVRQQTSSMKYNHDSKHTQQSSNKNNQPHTTKPNFLKQTHVRTLQNTQTQTKSHKMRKYTEKYVKQSEKIETHTFFLEDLRMK